MNRATLSDLFRRQGFVFDLTIFLSFLIIPLNAIDLDNAPDGLIATLLITGIVTQSAGAWLKRPFVDGDRLAQATLWTRRFFRALIWLHFLVFTVAILMSLALLGIYDGSSDSWVAATLLLAAILSWIVFRAGQGSTKTAAAPAWQSLAANALLWLSAAVMTRLFWGMLVDLIDGGAGFGLSGTSLTLIVALSMLFIVFYLPVRYLFLLKDYASPWTWLQIGLAILPAYVTVVFG